MAGTIFGIAFLAAISRTTVQIKKRRPLSVDDAFFAFACVCLCASTALLFQLMGALYFEQKLVLDPNSIFLTTAFQIIPELLGTQRLSYAHLTLTWTVIFSVKFSFMFFFKNLIKRVKNLNIYWRVVVWINAVSYFLCISDVFISCPHITLAGGKSLSFLLTNPPYQGSIPIKDAIQLIRLSQPNAGTTRTIANHSSSPPPS